MTERDDLNPREREEFAALPREREPSPFLEERTVRALKQRGLIRTQPGRTRFPQPWLGLAAAAAGVAMFASGIALGQWIGARQTAGALAAVYPDQAERAAALVQSTGSDYRAALSGLVDATEAADPEEKRRAREVALAAFWAAASEVVRLAPDDPLAAQILQEFERAREGQRAGEGMRSVVWF